VGEADDESGFWIEMLSDCEIVLRQQLEVPLAEAQELNGLCSAPRRTATAR
jgi:hypothetical protein